MQHTAIARNLIVCAVVIAIAACGGAETNAPAQSNNVSGTWHGTTQDNLAGQGRLAYSLVQHGASVSGTWSVTYSSPSFNDGGPVTGTVSGQIIQMTLAPASPNPCTTQASGTLNRQFDQTSGTYNTGSCPPQESGTFVVTKQ